MANIEDLGYTSILNMDNDEAIDLLRQIRLSRRMPERRVTKTTRTKTIPKISSDMAADILKILEGNLEDK